MSDSVERMIGGMHTKVIDENGNSNLSIYSQKKSLEALDKETSNFINLHVAHYKQLKGKIKFVEIIPQNVLGKMIRKDQRQASRKQQQQKPKLSRFNELLCL
ncbi:MAG: hypothetical protein EXX96DRAFT_610391 [Benjaminiella poitrasii]|nr:MAG: hypothetical protein EXX96DRAFT_610391 [Benjaminiella poitrasii]